MHFGSYGIGFRKDWGIANRISPVSYVHENSIASTTIDNNFNILPEILNFSGNDWEELKE